MKSQEIFALAVRIAGLVSLLYLGATSVVFFGVGLPWQLLARTIIWAVLSLWLIRGAPALVRFAYPDKER
jgi:hypothetical protein